MKVTVVGTGYVGLVTGTCLAEWGHDVMCLDLDASKIARLRRGDVPIYEPGLAPLIARNQQAGRLRFTTDVADSVEHGDIQFIAVGTPPDEDGSADLRHVLEAARQIARHMDSFKVIVNKSTVPVGTAERVHDLLDAELHRRGASCGFAVVSNPEFLKEGSAVADFLRPDRVIIGCDAGTTDHRARAWMSELYAPLENASARLLWMDARSAELTKYAANAMLATRISLMNEYANLAEALGADIEEVRRGLGSDPRIGPHFLKPGVGYGGSCFPKDVQALVRMADRARVSHDVLDAVEAVNARQKLRLVEKLKARLGARLDGFTVALWGLAFKPETDDMREAPSRRIIVELLRLGARVRVFDPVAMDEAQHVVAKDLAGHPQQWKRIHWASSALDAARGSDALLLVTEWAQFAGIEPAQLADALSMPLVLDGRNLWEPAAMAAAGIEHHGIGRAPPDNSPRAEPMPMRRFS